MQVRNPALAGLGQSDWRGQYRHFTDQYYVPLDFTTIEYDTKAECIQPHGPGLRFSDNDTPFPSWLRRLIAGTWTHVAATGWQPATGVGENDGPGLLIPLLQPGQWELEVVLDYSAPAGVDDEGYCSFGYITNSNHVGACATIYDNAAGATQLIASLETNNGDDTFTTRYTGAILAGPFAGPVTYRFRCMNGCVSVWDDQDDAWHDYEDRPALVGQVAAIPYTAAWAFIQFADTGNQFWTIYVQSLSVNYIV